MAIIGVSVEKTTDFRGVQQPFTNVYYYKRVVPVVNTEYDTIKNELVTAEKLMHSTLVTFKKFRLWTADGSPGENEMLNQQDLSGTGSLLANTSMDKERAFLVMWPAGKDTRGKPVYLRKWYHACGNPTAQAISNDQLQNISVLSAPQRAEFANKANDLKVVGPVIDTWSICAKSGRETSGDAQCHRYLEHHQLGDQWRG
jgi:hypothetical protein